MFAVVKLTMHSILLLCMQITRNLNDEYLIMSMIKSRDSLLKRALYMKRA